MIDSFTVATYMPEYIKRCFENISDYADNYDIYISKALSKLLNSPEMVEVYESLARYYPTEDFWENFLFRLADSYSNTITRMNIIESEYAKAFFSDLSYRLYKVTELLEDDYMLYLSNWDEEFFHRFTERANDLQKPLYNLLRNTTTLKWPELEYNSIYYSNSKTDGYLNYEETKKIKDSELNEITNYLKDKKKKLIFPTPKILDEYKPPHSSDYKIFVANALEALSHISEETQRKRRYFRKHTKTIPDKNNYYYIENSHWQNICCLLFNRTSEQITDLSKIQADHQKRKNIEVIKLK
jgi:hypothetical protein